MSIDISVDVSLTPTPFWRPSLCLQCGGRVGERQRHGLQTALTATVRAGLSCVRRGDRRTPCGDSASDDRDPKIETSGDKGWYVVVGEASTLASFTCPAPFAPCLVLRLLPSHTRLPAPTVTHTNNSPSIPSTEAIRLSTPRAVHFSQPDSRPHTPPHPAPTDHPEPSYGPTPKPTVHGQSPQPTHKPTHPAPTDHPEPTSSPSLKPTHGQSPQPTLKPTGHGQSPQPTLKPTGHGQSPQPSLKPTGHGQSPQPTDYDGRAAGGGPSPAEPTDDTVAANIRHERQGGGSK